MSRAGLVEWQLLCDSCEEISDVLGGLCGRLEEEEAGFAGVSLGVGGRDSSLVGLLSHKIELVSSQCDDDVLVSLALEFLDPGLGLV